MYKRQVHVEALAFERHRIDPELGGVGPHIGQRDLGRLLHDVAQLPGEGQPLSLIHIFYGTFAIVLGLIGWIYLGAMLTMYCAEANVVRARRCLLYTSRCV